MKKIFVLDTNVLLHDPRAIFSFEDNDVIIPIVVIEELDKFKKGIDEIGRNARQVSRILDEYRLKGKAFPGGTARGRREPARRAEPPVARSACRTNLSRPRRTTGSLPLP